MEVKIELGHKAWKNIKPTKEGYTHDWTVFVQGVNGNEIKHIVEKVIFHLPDSYPDSNRMKEKPPYELSESSSKGLSIKIDVFFCPEANLKKVNYIYDVFIGDEVVNISWERKLAFPNPSKVFKEKLLLAGGEIIDLLNTFPLMTGEFPKIKDEPVDEVPIVNNVDDAALNTPVQTTDNLQNESLTSSDEHLDFNKLMKENQNLKKANVEIKEKINLQEKLMAYYEENISQHEANILNTNLSINQLKKKFQAEEREITNLKLQLQMLQVKNKLLRIQNSPSDHHEKKTRGTKRKNDEDLNVSATVGKENDAQPTKFISSSSQNSPLLKNAFALIENHNVCESDKSNSAVSAVQNASVSEETIQLDDLCDIFLGVGSPSHSKNGTQSFNDNSNEQQNSCKDKDFKTSKCSKEFSSESTNTCDVEKSIERNSDKANASLNKSDKKNKNIQKRVKQSSVKVNSSLNTPDIIIIDDKKSVKRRSVKANVPEIVIIDAEKYAKRRSDKVNDSLNTPEIITIDDEESAKGGSTKTNVYLNTPEIYESTKGRSAKANVSVNKPDARNNNIGKRVNESSMEVDSSLNTPERIIDAAKRSPANANISVDKLRNNDVEKNVKGNSLQAHTFVNKLPIELYNMNKKQFVTPIQENHVSSTERTITNSTNLNRKQEGKLSNCGGTKVSSITPSNTKAGKKKKKKGGKGLSILTNSCQALAAENKLHSEPSGTNKTQEQNSSSNINSSKSNCKENGEKVPVVGGSVFSSITQSNTNLKIIVSNRREQCNRINVFQDQTAFINAQDLNDISAPKFTSFLAEHCLKLAAELDRIKNSESSKYKETTNLLFYKLGNINSNPISNDCFFQYVRSLIDYFSDPKTLDMPTLIYVVVDYLSRDTTNPELLYTYFQNQDVCVFVRPSENCIVHALFECDKSLPHLNGLIKNTLNIIHQVIMSKKKMTPYGLAALCRVFMEICKCNNEKWEPLFLCCELLRLGHPLAPYLINSLAAVWRAPFHLYNNFSVEENMVLGSIHYGIKDKPPLMDCNLWSLTLRLRATYFPRQFIVAPHHALQFLTTEIASRCVGGSFQNLWMLASPLVIFVSKETWESKLGFRNGFIVPKLLQFSRCSNHQGFLLFCNLFVDIFSFCIEGPYEQILQYFTNPQLYQGLQLIQDCAAVALLKYIGTTDKHIPAPLRDWFIKNKDDPKLTILIDLYCKKVMESRNSFVLWEDIILV